MQDLAALRLQLEWGADEALDERPHDRFAAAVSRPAPTALPAPRRTPRAEPATTLPQAAPNAANDLAALHQALDAFQTCALRATASHTVAPTGNPAAGLVFIAEAPGPDDDRAGQAFSGPPGERLDRILASASLSRADLLLGFLVPWRPPGGRPPNDTEIAQCLPFLHRLLTLTRPSHLVLLGAAPLRALGDRDANLRKSRGKWTSLNIPGSDQPIPTLPMLSPENWLSTPANKQAVWTDLLLIKEALASKLVR